MALTRVQGLLPALGWAEHYRHRLFQDSVADWVRVGRGEDAGESHRLVLGLQRISVQGAG